MRLWGRLADSSLAEESRRTEEVMQLRRILAALVLQNGGTSKVEAHELITMAPHVELSIFLDERGDLNFKVTV